LAWQQTSSLLAQINNVRATKRSQILTPNQCNPLVGDDREIVMELDASESVSHLRQLLIR